MIGIQLLPTSFLAEGTQPVLDILQERGAVDALFVEVYSHGRPRAEAAAEREPPDHGRQEIEERFNAGTYLTPRPASYRDTELPTAAGLKFTGYDVLASILPAAHRRGIKVFASYGDAFYKDVAGFDELREVDWQGQRMRAFCPYNPGYRQYVAGLTDHCCSGYEIDGIMWTSEQQGPLHNAIGASHGGGDSSHVTCFCEHHQAEARARGIDVARAKAGFARLDEFVRAARAGQAVRDGCFVQFWRILLEYPELLAWETLCTEGKYSLYREVARAAKARRPAAQVGFHIWHANSFSPFFRAQQEYREFAAWSDYLKIVAYNNSGGPRYAAYIHSVSQTIFRDVAPEKVLRLHNRWLGYGDEAPLETLPSVGLSADYVARETERAVEDVRGACRIYTGIDIDIPTAAKEIRTSPQSVYDSTTAALRAGADGVILCRRYSEMRLANLSAAGRAVRDAGRR